MRSVLLIDRTPSVFRIREIAEEEQIRLIEVSDETTAIKTVRQIGSELDMVIIDIMLDYEDDGFEVIKKITEMEPDLPIIILTSNGQRKAIALGLKLGAKDYILKPFDSETIRNRIFSKTSDRVPFAGVANRGSREEIMSILGSELLKSKKGNYPLTIMLSTYYNENQTTKWIRNNDYGSHTVSFAAGIKEILFETDYLYPFEGNTVLGILPFCDEEKLRIVDEKMRNKGNTILEELGRSGYILSTTYMAFPDEFFEGGVDDVIESLFANVSKLIEEKRQSIFAYSRSIENVISSIESPGDSVKLIVENSKNNLNNG